MTQLHPSFPNSSITMIDLPYSIEVYISISRPSLLLLSIGSALISTPGPTRLASPLCVGKIYHITISFHSHPSPLQPSILPPPIYINHQTYLSPTPPQPIRRLIRNQLSKAQHESVDERQQEVYSGAAHEAPERGGLVEDEGRGGGGWGGGGGRGGVVVFRVGGDG